MRYQLVVRLVCALDGAAVQRDWVGRAATLG